MDTAKRKRHLAPEEKKRLWAICHDKLCTELQKQGAEPGTWIPGEVALSKKFDMPLRIVREFLDRLRQDGTIAGVRRGKMRLQKMPEPRAVLAGKRIAIVAAIEEKHPNSIITHPMVMSLTLESWILEQNGTMEFFNLHNAENGIAGILSELASGNFSAIIIWGSENPQVLLSDLKPLEKLMVPVIAIEFSQPPPFCHTIGFSDEQIGHEIASCLIRLGHRKVFVMRYPGFDWSRRRAAAILSDFQAAGLALPTVCDMSSGTPPLEEIVEFLRNAQGRCTAIVAGNDNTAKLLFTSARILKLHIPDDFSLIGIDDLPGVRFLNLTTVQLSGIALAETAFNLLKRLILNPQEPPRHVFVPTPLIERRTTRRVPLLL